MPVVQDEISLVKVANGDDGKGIVSNATTYQAGTSGTTPPTGTWSTSIPSVSENQYLWTKIVLTYSDNTNSTAYSVGKMGAKGETGSTGSTGATGNGIKSTTINFASSTSGTTAPSSGWSTSIPTVAAGSFLWTRTVLTFTDNTTNTSYTVAKQGEKGDPTGIISQATVPTNPYVGMLWQNTGASGYIIGATYQWNGSKFNLYIFTADNIVATTLSAITANLGNVTAGNISGVTINGSKFVNEFSYQPYPNNASLWCFGTTTIENGRWNTEYRQEGNKGIGIVDHTGTAILDPTGVQFSQTMVASNGENSFAKFNALELTMNYGGRGGTLTYNDLYSLPKTEIPAASGWSPYSTSSSNTNYPAATRTGRTVQLTGAFKNNSLLSNANTSYVIGILPVGFRPSAACKYPQKSNGDVIFMVTVNINGEIAIDYRLGWSGSAYGFVSSAAGSIFNIAGTFAAADI
nr:MAG TPA: tail protein [Caudoviricetes sp.]